MDKREALRRYSELMKERQRIIEMADHLADAGNAQEAAECIESVKRLDRELADSRKALERYVESIRDVKVRIIFRLHYLGGYTWEATAASLGAKPEAVRSTVNRFINAELGEQQRTAKNN